MNKLAIFCLSCTLLAPTMSVADETAALKLERDPFAVPRHVRAAIKTPGAAPVSATDEVNETEPTLKAVVMAGSRSMANLDGKVITVGQLHNGFKLVSVNNAQAVLTKNGKTYHLKMQ